MRSRLFFGLRGHIVLALIGTSTLTIGVVLLTLLSPLERRLRNDELEGLREAGAVVRSAVSDIPRRYVHARSARLSRDIRTVAERVDAQVVVVSRDGRVLDSTVSDPGARAAHALTALRGERSFTTETGDQLAKLATYASTARVGRSRVGFSVSRRLDEVNAAARVVRRAVIVAALVGLGTALLLGMVLATGLVRRLRGLRDTALRVARLGPVVEMAPDRTRDEVGDLSRAFATMQDRLRQQDEAGRMFVSTASHELRTPLSSLCLMLDLAGEELARAGPSVATAQEEVERAGLQARRLAALADQLLDLSRIDAGMRLEDRPVDLEPLAAAVVREFSDRAARGDQSLELDAAPGTWALGDPGAVVQILRLGLDNALRFHPPGGPPLVVSVAADTDRCVVRIRDHGPGVAPEERDHVFERFRRGSNTGGDGGFGLGLPIGRELARRMNGELILCDATPGVCLELRLARTSRPD